MAQEKGELLEHQEAASLPDKESDSDEKGGATATILECAVCLQVCIHPVKLPCGHIFCYLCVKGVANQSKRCPMCRQEIPPDFLERPNLVEPGGIETELTGVEDEYHWFYEGRNGWWKYDRRTNDDLETIYKLGEARCEILICGTLYVIDFEKKYQYKKWQPDRKRYIKRDRKDCQSKGVAGWWQYDLRTSCELETAYKQGKRTCELLIAGFLYIADFGTMLQLRRNDPLRCRRIKRDLRDAPKIGIAGLRVPPREREEQDQEEQQQQQQQQQLPREIRGAERPPSPVIESLGTGDGTNTPQTPNNTPQTATGGATSGNVTPSSVLRSQERSIDSLHSVLEEMQSLILRDHAIFNDSDLEEVDD